MSANSSVSPLTAVLAVVAVVIVAAGAGFWYLARPKSDPIAAAVRSAGARTTASAADPMMRGRTPPRAGAHDYAAPSQ